MIRARADHLFAAAVLGAFCAALWAFRGFVADDAFIVGRYALNAAEGLGLVYNPGERVSALTSPLHALLLSLIALVTDDPVAVYRWLGPVLVLGGGALSLRIAGLGRREAAVWAVTALAPPMVALWSIGGLETPILYALLSLYGAGLTRVWCRGRAGRSDYALIATAAALAFLTRHDSALVTLPPMLFVAAHAWRSPALWRSALAAAGFAGAWLIFAQSYYGGIFPTSAYLKLSDATSNPGILSAVLVPNALLVTGVAIALPFLRPALPADPLRRALARGGMVAGLLFVAYAIQVSAEHMMFGYRFYVPYLPLMGFLLARQAARIPAAILVAMLAVQGAVGWRMATTGANVVPTTLLPGAELGYEWATWTPRSYGRFMDTLEDSAREVRTHWEATGRDDTPRIFLWSGGAGYWLRGFHVFETLVSFRRDCPAFRVPALMSSHYVQFVPVGFDSGHAAFLERRADIRARAERLSGASLAHYGDERIHYVYGPAPEDRRLPPRLGDPCDSPPQPS